jgi:hypothetical protein
LAVDRRGNLYAGDLGTILYEFAPRGALLDKWYGTGVNRLVAVDDQGAVYVRDGEYRAVTKCRQAQR